MTATYKMATKHQQVAKDIVRATSSCIKLSFSLKQMLTASIR